MTKKTAKDHGFQHPTNAIFENASQETWMQHAVQYTGAKLTPSGALAVYTGKHTGRAAKDKYVVMTPKTEKTIDWKNNINTMTPDTFSKIKSEMIAYFNTQPRLYRTQRNVGSMEKYALGVELFTTHPSHSLFFSHLMRNDGFKTAPLGQYTIFHAPTFQVDSSKHKTRSETVVAMDLDNQEILIVGTLYAGEIKKAVFSAMNYILPDLGILPMHAGSNVSHDGDVSVFFGLSGTGKTTLSTQEGRPLIGDDEHGISQDGIFNFEGGCYAKTFKLSKSGEPGIYKATNMKGAILENVVLRSDGTPDFDDASLGENGRSAYPLSFIDDVDPDSKGKMPSHVFFLSADAFGVLPPVSKLTAKQAMYYFLSGYTAKVAGTEMGVKEPTATFSTCFGAPFMMRPSTVYAKLLGHYIQENGIGVWLINTGWTGGAYGVGSRFPLKVTRRIIEAIQNGELDKAEFTQEANFGLSVPTKIDGVDERLLNPEKTWTQGDYKGTAKKLGGMFSENFAAFHSNSGNLLNGSSSKN